MEPIYLASLISFVVGAIAYIIIQFWIRPILQFKKVKKKVISVLHTFDRTTTLKNQGPNTDRSKLLRQYSMELSDCYNIDLPYWYKLLLDSRKESPVEASRHLMSLANITHHQDAKKHIDKIIDYIKTN